MRPPWLVIGLVVSAGLNLFLVGAAVGVTILIVATAKNRQEEPRLGPLIVATQGLPQPDRSNLRQMLAGLRRDARVQSDQSRQLRLTAWGALADPKPDVVTIKQQLAQSRQLDLAVRTTVEERLVDYVAGLTPQDRTAFAAGMRRVLTPPLAPQPATPPSGGR